MNPELPFHTYVLLGNALNYLVKEEPPILLAVKRSAIDELYRTIEPLPPPQVLPAVAALEPEQKAILHRSMRHLLDTFSDEEITARLGLSRDEAEAVLHDLSLEAASHA